MNPVKIAAIILIIAAGLVGSYFIIKNPISSSSLGQAQDISSLKPSIQNPLKWVENTVKSLTGNSPVERGDNIKTENKNTTNLTELVAKTMFSQMKDLDQGEKNPFQGQNFDPNDPQSQQLIQEALASIQDPDTLFNPSVEDKDLKISQDNSVEAKSKYFSEAAQIILKNFNESNINFQKALENFTNNLDIFGIGQIADAYSKILDGFLDIQVPSDYLDLHKRYIILLKKAKETYLGLADYSNDPVRAGLSMQLVPKIAEAELEIKQEYYQKSLNLGL